MTWWLSRLASIIRDAPRAVSGIGLGQYLRYRATLSLDWISKWKLFALRLDHYVLTAKTSRFELVCRTASSDRSAFRQVFVERQYSGLDRMADVRTIIDCGANVGYASAYLLSQHPYACAVAIEPDAGNFRMLERNMRPYGSRIRLMRAAVWSGPARLSLESGRTLGKGDWATRVRSSAYGETGEVDGVDIPFIASTAGMSRIDILKIDVEGAEEEIFRDGAPWLSMVRTIAIELHGRACREVFLNAIRGFDFESSVHGEIVVFQRSV